MQYKYCSMRDVITRLIRNTRLKDSSYLADAHEWVYEAMEMMQTQQTLEGRWEDVNITFHKGRLPCGLIWIDAVEYAGRRLPEGGGKRPPEKDNRIPYGDSGKVFLSEVVQEPAPLGGFSYETKLTAVLDLSLCPEDYYYTEMGAINTSFREGKVTIYFRAVPVDRDGMPLIPDNQNYKQALYWYCRAMMIGAGYPDKQFTYRECITQFDEVYAPRAIEEITYPSVEGMQRRMNTLTRLLPYEGYYDSFFHTDRPEPDYDISYL